MEQNRKKGSKQNYNFVLTTNNSTMYLSPSMDSMKEVGENQKYVLMQIDAFTTQFFNQKEMLVAISNKLGKDVTSAIPGIYYNHLGTENPWLDPIYDDLEILLPFITLPYSGMVQCSFLFRRQVQEFLSHCKNPDFLEFVKNSDYFSNYLYSLMLQYVNSGYKASYQSRIATALSCYKTLRGTCLGLREYIPDLGLLDSRGERRCRILQR